MRLALFSIVLTGLVSGCATVVPVPTQTKVVERPPLNVVHVEELGNTLLEYFVSNTQPSIKVLDQWGISSRRKDLPPQILRPVGIGEKVSRYYVENAPPGTEEPMRRVCFDPTDSVLFIPNGYDICDFVGKAIINSGPVRVEPAEYIDIRAPQFKQELIYNGKVGNSVKFLYRELSGGYLRVPFTQDVQYDLAEGNEIGFKGARLEIVNSSNRYIEYRVLKTFNRP